MICEKCGKEHDGSYGSGRFCSQSCARSFSTTNNSRKEINKKISNKLAGRKCKMTKNRQNYLSKRHNDYISKKLDKAVWVNGDTLDITNRELDQYMLTHTVCEICGKSETAITYTGNTNRTKPNRLCIDHDHSTKKFRGLLCVSCNSKLGWYQNNKEQIEKYLNKN